VDPEFSKTLYEGNKTRIMQYKAAHRRFLFSLLRLPTHILPPVVLYPAVIGIRRLWPTLDQRVLEAGGK
jgi:hypothetical protein